ncbi:MAG: hypothetical protein CMJ93_02335 [Planctomycetes bacterium]|nr:hypothetical protein [Planctomycetota bacterium]
MHSASVVSSKPMLEIAVLQKQLLYSISEPSALNPFPSNTHGKGDRSVKKVVSSWHAASGCPGGGEGGLEGGAEGGLQAYRTVLALQRPALKMHLLNSVVARVL